MYARTHINLRNSGNQPLQGPNKVSTSKTGSERLRGIPPQNACQIERKVLLAFRVPVASLFCITSL